MASLERKLKAFGRGEMQRCAWLDAKTLRAVQDIQASRGPVRCFLKLYHCDCQYGNLPCRRCLHFAWICMC